jgi:regulator of RNase E activity RraA
MTIDSSTIAELANYSTPTVLNGLKRLGQHPMQLESMDRNQIECMSPGLGIRVGFAATRKIATRRDGSDPGPERNLAATQQMQEALMSVPAPRILVVENVGDWSGPVCIWGELGASINLAFECAAGVTNGPVRDLPEMEAIGFQTFAGGPGVGGGFVDFVEAGAPVSVGGIEVHSGDLIHADRHGVVKIPIDLAAALPAAIRAFESFERVIIDVCRSSDFSVDKLAQAWRTAGQQSK